MDNPEIMILPLFQLGPIDISVTVVTTWGIMAIICLFSWLVSRRLSVDNPGMLQSAVEGIILVIEEAVADAAPQHARQIMPLIASLWIFLVIANLCGLIPGVNSPPGIFPPPQPWPYWCFCQPTGLVFVFRASEIICAATSHRVRSYCLFI